MRRRHPQRRTELETLIGKVSVVHGQVQVQVGASVGTSPLVPDATPAETIEAADKAMYARKQERRDQFLPPLSSPA
jgi:PleD family two-component response regulator